MGLYEQVQCLSVRLNIVWMITDVRESRFSDVTNALDWLTVPRIASEIVVAAKLAAT